MGIHTGAPTAYEGGYVGMDVHRCARMAGAAHGGQIVISDATAEHLGSRLAHDVRLLDLGLHQLKDLPELERLHQVFADGLPAQFPPLKSLGAVSRLPSSATPLVGRQDELAQLAALVGLDGARLVTLTGSGGSGKTRLALELARRCVDDFPDGVHFIPLAEARTTEQVWDSIGEGLGTAPGRTAVLGRLGTLRLLMVLDNLEQLEEADVVVAQLLRAARRVTLVVTSRQPLHLAEEHEYPCRRSLFRGTTLWPRLTLRRRCSCSSSRASTEPMDVPDVGQQPRGTGRADPGQLQQARTALPDQEREFLFGSLDLAADALELGDELDVEPAPRLPDEVTGLDRGDQRAGLRRGQERLRAARDQFQQKPPRWRATARVP